VRILIVDDHRLFRESLILLLREHRAEVSPIQAASLDEALAALKVYPDTDLILLDLALPGVDGMAGLPRLREAAPTVPIMVLSATAHPDTVRHALTCGAVGYLHKSVGTQEMRHAMDLVFRGEVYVPLDLLCHDSAAVSEAAAPQDAIAVKALLTPRQQEVLALMSEGLPNKLIARRMALSEATVKLHVSAILRTLGAKNRTDAVRLATLSS
jgi:DNA-binding NarL/FixJ family response regulator